MVQMTENDLYLQSTISNKTKSQHYKREKRKTNEGNLATFSWDFSVYEIKHVKRKSLSYPFQYLISLAAFSTSKRTQGARDT